MTARVLCKKGCGRPVAPGSTKAGAAFDTCCRKCAKGQGHDPSCDQEAAKLAVPCADKESDQHSKWEVETDEGWKAWSPGVPFSGIPHEKVCFTMGSFPMEAIFLSEDTGTQVNLQTKRERRLRRMALDRTKRIAAAQTKARFVVHDFQCHTFLQPTWCAVCKSFLWGMKEQGSCCMICLETRCFGCDKAPADAGHDFARHTFGEPTWCAVCKSFLWGISKQGDRCHDCLEARCLRCVQTGGHCPHKARTCVPEFPSLHDAFKFCRPNKSGLITDRCIFAAVAAALANDRGDRTVVWSHLDQDGNGAVSFPEFVEWAEARNVKVPTGVPDGDILMTFPKTWTGPRDDPSWKGRPAIADTTMLSELQELLDATQKAKGTRDRMKMASSGRVPTRFKLEHAERSENYEDWRGYYLKRHLIEQQLKGDYSFQQYEPLTAIVRSLCSSRHGLRARANEWLLFHGTTKASAGAIAKGDFKMSLAGSRAGTMYGRGTYFAESITKSDEYVQEGWDGTCTVLLCRVIGGKVLYNSARSPDAKTLEESVLSAGYHSILGDREKAAGTFKEYIVFDADQVYVEYILQYRRVYS